MGLAFFTTQNDRRHVRESVCVVFDAVGRSAAGRGVVKVGEIWIFLRLSPLPPRFPVGLAFFVIYYYRGRAPGSVGATVAPIRLLATEL